MKRISRQILYLFISMFCLSTLCVAKSNKTFTVLQLNTWHAGATVPGGAKGIVDVVRQINADVVFLCEIHGNNTLSQITSELEKQGLSYYGESHGLNVGILSKIKPDSVVSCCSVPGNEVRALIKAVVKIDDQPISFYSAHLDHQNYGCYLPRGYGEDFVTINGVVSAKKADRIITDEDKVLEINRTSYRDESIRSFIQYVQSDLEQGIPAVLGGDFNEPSHLDWQADTKDLRDHNGAIINWDCSVLLQNAGFKDAFREKYPDPVRNPGITYPAGNRLAQIAKLETLTYTPDADERDRIDFIYYHPLNKILSLKKIQLVGPAETVTHNEIVENDSKDRFIIPDGVWPSDHKGTLATFKICNK